MSLTTLLRREPLLLGITAGFVLALGLGAGIVLGVPAPAERALAARTLCLIMGLAVGGTAAGVAWRIHPRSRRAALAWASLAAAQLSLCWSLTAAGLSAGLVSLASSAFFLAGAAGLPAGRTSGRQRAQQALDTAAILLAAGLLFWAVWGGRLGALPAAAGDVLLVWALAALLFRPAQPPLARLSLALSALVRLAADLAAADQVRQDLYQAGGLLDLGGLLQSGFLWLACGSQISAARPAASAEPAPAWLPYAQLSAPALAGLGAYGLLLTFGAPLRYAALPLATTLVLGLARQLLVLPAEQPPLPAEGRLPAELEARVAARTQELERANQALRQNEARLAYEAFHDPVTGLPNRALCLDRLERALERARRNEQYRFAVLFLDCDGFKVVNDSLGHSAGDQLLKQIAGRLQGCLRSADTVARFGGDEFVVLLEDVHGEADALQAAERIQAALAQACPLGPHSVFISASLGIVLSTPAYEQAEHLLRDADLAMYQAKEAGKARHAVFDASMRARALARLNLESDLRAAFERHEFDLHYQPILDLRQRRLAGFEALLRWRHPHLGPIAPAEFIPVAEETGLIVPLGDWVLREACRQIKAWQARFPSQPPLTVSVNLSARQLRRPGLAAQVEALLQELDLAPSALKLEVTESAIIEDAASVAATLGALRALGVHVQIDDFGTGYSSLSYLYRFPIDALKIDRTFVSRIGAQGENAEFVRTIAALAHELGLSVVAEGVETRDQIAAIEAVGCEQAQGYLVSRPLDSGQAAQFIADQQPARSYAAG